MSLGTGQFMTRLTSFEQTWFLSPKYLHAFRKDQQCKVLSTRERLKSRIDHMRTFEISYRRHDNV